MSDSTPNPETPQTSSQSARQYIVVARRYRPQTFDELVGQQHVATALSNAIATGRVGHAYLFTGARGVGKTSAARILAKALDCQQGPLPVPCNQCDICGRISTGDDVDVLEIDGASNRGIDEIRQLRQNVNVRPSRARFKIYIIDEVHMLTREAFNALLKTLEEPPEHVKFIFCTTEPSKIPVTILSRCQRFDFAGIQTASIAQRLRYIAEAEGVAAEPEALESLARRAAGSMRDGQSLLEQLLALAPGRITLADVHAMLGTAADECLAELLGHLVDRDPAAALADLDRALDEGVDLAQLLEQLLGYLRDCMVAAAGCPAESLLYCSADSRPEIAESGKRLGVQTVLAAMQVLDQTLSRLRFTTQGRILAELALVRICQLEDLEELPALIAQLQSGLAGQPAAGRPSAGAPGPATGPQAGKKNAEPEQSPPTANELTTRTGPQVLAITAENAVEVWNKALAGLSGIATDCAREFEQIAIPAPNHLVIKFKPGYAGAKSFCERPDQLARFEQALAELTGQKVRVEFTMSEEGSVAAGSSAAKARPASPHQRLLEVMQHPMVRRAGELFGARPIRVDDPPNRE